ncbi:MAG: IclR family transcriptional regulator [Desulfobacteraceae bacterium]|jgi:DNA-binding IclR family transcriptional regulator
MKYTSSNTNSVEKALTILLAFTANRPVWGVRELSAHLNFSPATVQRLLTTLKNYAFVNQNPETRQYCLGNIYFNFLHALQSSNPISHLALPYMKKLASATQETVHLNVIDGMERICIENIESMQYLKASMPIGSRSPLYAGASSKCLLAFSSPEFIDNYVKQIKLVPLTNETIINKKVLLRELHQIKLQGYAISLGERNPGLGSLSAPIFNHNHNLLAALSLAVPEIRFKKESHRHNGLNLLTQTARTISKAMGAGTL